MLYPPSLRGVLLVTLLAAAGLAQQPPAVASFNVDAFPNYKSMAIGQAHCDFWSHLAATYPLESACYVNGAVRQIAVYTLGDVGAGHFKSADGEFTWILAPGTIYHFVAWPTGGVQASRDGTF